jgi:hypothetical protein
LFKRFWLDYLPNGCPPNGGMPYGCLPDCPQNTFKQIFGGFDVIMIGNSYQTPSMKDSWIFKNLKDNVNALAPIFWQTYAQCYELNKVM